MPEQPQISDALARNWVWLIVLAIVLIAGGTLAILAPFVTGLVVTTWVGIAFLASGVVQVIQCLQAKGWKGMAMHVLSGLLYIGGGVVLLFDPLAGLIALSLIVVVTLIASGLLRAYAAWQIRPDDGWGWIMASGILAVVAGIMIWASFPGSALWLLGLIAGISFIGEGWTLLFIGLAARRLASNQEPTGA